MLEITVKTLDSQSRNFSVPDNITVRGFKVHIAPAVGIQVDRQRLIFQGRVLQDDAQLNASGDISGKVLHLVERLPTPASTSTPTPAELAREPRPTHQPPPQATPMGPFGLPGPGGNLHGQLMQMIQQALSGAVPAVVRGTMRHPNAPDGDSRTEIQIHIEGQASPTPSTTSSTTRPRQTVPTTQAQQRVPANQPHRHGPYPHHHHHRASPQPVESSPRQHLLNVGVMTGLLEAHIKAFESGDFDNIQVDNIGMQPTPGTPGPSGGATSSGSSTDPTPTTSGQQTKSTPAEPSSAGQQQTQQGTGAAAAPPANPLSRHPRLPEYSRVIRRLADLEMRFVPFLNQYADFLEKDTSYQTTESPEYKKMVSFLTLVVKTQKLLGQIHRICSQIVIPISETPPRSILVQHTERGRNRGIPPNARPISNAIQAGPGYFPQRMPLFEPRGQTTRFIQGQVSVPMLVGPLTAGPATPLGGMPGMLGPIRPHQSGLYGHPAPSTPPTSTPPTSAPATAPTTSPNRFSSSTATTSQSSANLMAAAAPLLMPPSGYNVHVTANVEPHISINVALPELPSTEGETLIGDEAGSVAAASAQDTITVGDVNVSQIPNIPGVSRDRMQQIVEAVRRSVRQVAGRGMGRTTLGEIGTLELADQPEDLDVIPMEVAQMIGETVQEVVLHQLQTDQENRATSDSSVATATSPVTSTTTSSNSTATETTIPPTPTSPPADQQQGTTAPIECTMTTSPPNTTPSAREQTSHNPLVQLVSQVGNLAGAMLPQASAGPSQGRPTVTLEDMLGASALDGSSNIPLQDILGAAAAYRQSVNAPTGGLIGGSAGRKKKKIPDIRRTQNCVNDLVRGQGYPREMMELSGHESILSLLVFLCGELFTIPDCMTFITGAAEPAHRLREPLRQIITECWFDGQHPDADQIEAEVERHSEDVRPTLEEMFRDATPKSPDISIVESNLSLYRFILRKLLQLLYIHDANRFTRDILGHLLDSYSLALNLNTHILRGTEETVTRMMSNYLTTAIGAFAMGGSEGSNDPMADQMREYILSNLIPFSRSRPISQDQIDQFVMNVPSPEEVASEPTPPAVEQSPEVDPSAQPTVQEDEEMEEVGDTMITEETEVDWRLTVPNDWVPVMELDIEKQKTLPEQPEPHSEAYLAGTPASKRRKI